MLDEFENPWFFEINVYPGLYVFTETKELSIRGIKERHPNKIKSRVTTS